MEDELGSRERRYLEAYLELEPKSSSTAVGARERMIAAAFAGLEPVEADVPLQRSPRRGALVVAALGLCAAAAVAFWVGRATVIEEPAARLLDQAPSMRGDRPVYEVSAPGSGTAADRGHGPQAPREPAQAAATSPTATAAVPADGERQDARAAVRHGAERKPAVLPEAPHDEDSEDTSEPAPVSPTLSTAEVALLERARRSAQRGEHEAALGLLREHARSHPHSVLATERKAEEVAVLCRMGAESAESARVSFLAGDPPQYLRSRVEKACAR